MARCAGLDIGDRWIGVAFSDPYGILASPFTIIERIDDDSAIEAIADIVKKHEAGLVIAGLPQSMDGTEGEQAQKVRDFIDKLTVHLDVPVKFEDERLSTVVVETLMAAPGRKRSKRRERQDARAAAVILQRYLESVRE
jgi:putative Holliday junction resolvase